jgi:acyl transferase domain-containing protein
LRWSIITIQSQAVNKKDAVDPTHAPVHGLAGSMAKEYSNWKTRLVDLEADCDWPFDEIFSLPADPEGNAWGYRGGQWYRQQLIPIQLPGVSHTRYKEGGVYVVVGGAGGQDHALAVRISLVSDHDPVYAILQAGLLQA